MGPLQALTCPIGTMTGSGQRSWPGKGVTAKGSDPSRRKIWVTSPGKPPGPARLIARHERNLEWTEEKTNEQTKRRDRKRRGREPAVALRPTVVTWPLFASLTTFSIFACRKTGPQTCGGPTP